MWVGSLLADREPRISVNHGGALLAAINGLLDCRL